MKKQQGAKERSALPLSGCTMNKSLYDHSIWQSEHQSFVLLWSIRLNETFNDSLEGNQVTAPAESPM